MTTRVPSRRPAGPPILLTLIALAALSISACAGAPTPDSATGTDPTPITAVPSTAPTLGDDLLDELEVAADELDEFLDTDGDGLDDMEGQVDTDDGTGEAVEGAIDPDNGFSPSLYVDADDLGRILGEMPEPDCTHSQLFDGDACTWSTGDAAASLGVELYRDPNLATLEAYVAHMELIMGDGSPIDDLGQTAYSGPAPFGPGARVTVFLGDGLHLWVTISKDGDTAQVADDALELAGRIVALHES